MISVNIIGRVTAGCDLTYVGREDRPLAEFFVDVEDALRRDKPVYSWRVRVWGRKAEFCHPHLTPGRRIGISGRIMQDIRESTARPETVIIAETIDLLDKPAADTATP